jgi:hypothetical protein
MKAAVRNSGSEAEYVLLMELLQHGSKNIGKILSRSAEHISAARILRDRSKRRVWRPSLVAR